MESAKSQYEGFWWNALTPDAVDVSRECLVIIAVQVGPGTESKESS